MRFALLGADSESLQLAEAAVATGHKIAWHGDLGKYAASTGLALTGDRAEQWEDLLDEETADAVIVGRGAASEAFRAQQVQELVRLGRPVLATFPLVGSVLAYFEIDMARLESSAGVQHYNPLVQWAEAADAAMWASNGHPALGRVEQIVCTRLLAERTHANVLWHFARDVELLGLLAGRLNRIGAHAGAAREIPDYSALSAQLLGISEIPVRWAVEPPSAAEGLTLTWICQSGRATVSFDSADQLAEIHEGDAGGPSLRVAGEAPATAAVRRFVASLSASAASASTWSSALRAMELTDSIEISLRRGRMIDVHDRQLTEQLAFKGTMEALG
ncbi:MAG: hypothetical protein IT424_16350 [Pirellulales bacterium]|nr:hypothetical protein [Pirellulales bacterium]